MHISSYDSREEWFKNTDKDVLRAAVNRILPKKHKMALGFLKDTECLIAILLYRMIPRHKVECLSSYNQESQTDTYLWPEIEPFSWLIFFSN